MRLLELVEVGLDAEARPVGKRNVRAYFATSDAYRPHPFIIQIKAEISYVKDEPNDPAQFLATEAVKPS